MEDILSRKCLVLHFFHGQIEQNTHEKIDRAFISQMMDYSFHLHRYLAVSRYKY